MILFIDNYDSFVFNLVRYVTELSFHTHVVRNDNLSIQGIRRLKPSHIILSPGPCTPNEAGICLEVIKEFFREIPILGVCLGHQAIAQAFGGKIVRAQKPLHGKYSFIKHDEKGLFKGLSNPLKVGRYHSLIAAEETLPDDLMVTAYSEQHEIMALCHKFYPVFGVQFHPESVLTEQGHQLLKNFLAFSKQ